MRIRKNAKLSSLLRSPPDAPLPSHVCRLNQSPWDVLPFSFPDAALPQLDGEEDNSFTANGSFGDSIVAVESSVASMMAVDAEEKAVIVDKLQGHALYDDYNNEDGMNINGYEANKGGDFDGDFSFKACCNKTDGKRWQCKKEAVEGHYLCHHHLSQLKSYATTTAADDDDDDDEEADVYAARKLEKSSSSTTGRRGGRPRGSKKNSSSSSAVAATNSNQFYYYSGFGPSWGKRRSGRAGGQPRRPEGRAGGGSQSNPQRIGGEGINYVDYDMDEEEEEEENEEEEEEEDGGGDSGKKRMRKPVKARSLKSLM